MKPNVDLTERQTFSRSRPSFDMSQHNFRFVVENIDDTSRFRQALRIPHWVNKCIRKPDIYFKLMGITLFRLQCNLNKYIYDENVDIDGCVHCICCGKVIPPYRDMCRRCESSNSASGDRQMMTLDDYNSWPNTREVMRSNPAILHRS